MKVEALTDDNQIATVTLNGNTGNIIAVARRDKRAVLF